MDVQWFKARQKAAGLTVHDLGRALGRDRAIVSRIYTGRQKLTFDQAKVLAEVLQVPLAEVLRHAGMVDPAFSEDALEVNTLSDVEADLQPDAHVDYLNAGFARLFKSGAGTSKYIVRRRVMELGGFLPGDHVLVDSSGTIRPKSGVVVLGRIFDPATNVPRLVLRRFRPPVIVTETADQSLSAADVVDDLRVEVRGVVLASWRSYEPTMPGGTAKNDRPS